MHLSQPNLAYRVPSIGPQQGLQLLNDAGKLLVRKHTERVFDSASLPLRRERPLNIVSHMRHPLQPPTDEPQFSIDDFML